MVVAVDEVLRPPALVRSLARPAAEAWGATGLMEIVHLLQTSLEPAVGLAAVVAALEALVVSGVAVDRVEQGEWELPLEQRTEVEEDSALGVRFF